VNPTQRPQAEKQSLNAMAEVLPSRRRELQRFLQKLGLPTSTTVNWYLLDKALTHVSFDPSANYEQLELLGDAVLRLAATECLQDCYPDETVGELSALRSVLTSDRTLAQLAESLGVGTYLLVSEACRNDPLGQPARLADALESVLGALYLETHNLSLVRPWLDSHLQRLAHQLRQDPSRNNPKAALQELTQAHAKTLPRYDTIEQKPVDGHPERYRSTVWFRENCWGTGFGSTKKLAEQAAAAEAHSRLKQHLESSE
jgi:ribonuclease-3